MRKLVESAELRALANDIKSNIRKVISELNNIAKLIDARNAGTTPDVNSFSISKTVAILLLTLGGLPRGASLMCAEYGECMCDEIDDDEDEHICFDEVTEEDIYTLATSDTYQTFEVWL